MKSFGVLAMALVLLTMARSVRAAGSACSPAASNALSASAAAMNRGNWDAAESALGRVTDGASDCPPILLARARIAAAHDRTEEATNLFRAYIQQAPEDPEGYAYFARLMIDGEEYPKADEMSAIALQKSANNAAALAVRGQLLAVKGDKLGALNLVARACELSPDDEEAQFQLGTVYDHLKRPGDAVNHFAKATELNREDARAWDYLALDLEPLGKIAEAEKAFATALEVNREGPYNDAFLDYNYGRFLMKKGDLAASKTHLDRAVQLVPDMRATWYERARLDILLKDFKAARQDAEKAASINDPDGLIIDLQLYTMLEQIYRRLGETELAVKYAELARTTPPPVRGERR